MTYIQKRDSMRSPLGDPVVAKRISYHPRLARLVSYMQEHTLEEISLERAAEIACMERTSFSRFFRRAVGMTFQDFVQQWRVVIAVEQMLKSDFSLTQIAETAGFSSIASLERTFKKCCGSTPSEYRKHLLAEYGLMCGTEVSSKPQAPRKSSKEV